MKQSRRASAIESTGNIAIGFTLQYLALYLSMLAINVPLSHPQNLTIGVIMTVVSFARSYFLRRLFETLRTKGFLP